MATTTKPREPRTRRLRRLAVALALGTSAAWATVGGAGVVRADLPPGTGVVTIVATADFPPGPNALDYPPGPGAT